MDSVDILRSYILAIHMYDDEWTRENIMKYINGLVDHFGEKKKTVLPILQIALSDSTVSVDVYTMMHSLGKEETLLRFASLHDRIVTGEFNEKSD